MTGVCDHVKQMQLSFALLLLLLLSLLGAGEPACGVAFVLLGSTGDLARRYLLPALFTSSAVPQGCSLVVLAATRRHVTDPDLQWKEMAGNIQCPSGHETCDEVILKFRETLSFVVLGSERDYKRLQNVLQDEMASRNFTEIGRVFYLSVPSSAYSEILKNIDSYARPPQGVWLRVAMEKPFGRDYASANSLVDDILQRLRPQEAYLVDHYLCKPGVQLVRTFREGNMHTLAPLWNSKHIQHIEVVAKERLDVSGRSRFYDDYGVIRDMLQSHLTEVLLRLVTTGGLPLLQAASHIVPPRLEHAALGQYAGYQEHLQQDGVTSSSENLSRTPTFASVRLQLRDPTFSAVPVFLTSGKRLDERTAFARVLFKEAAFPANSSSTNSCRPEIVFIIQDEALKKPGVLVSLHFPSLRPPPPAGAWEVTQLSVRGCAYSFLYPAAEGPRNTYVSVIAALLLGDREQFVSVDSLLQSWAVWSGLLEEYEASRSLPTVYTPNTAAQLSFMGGTPNDPPLVHPNDPPVLFSPNANQSHTVSRLH